jgi:hypothetical protein
MKAFTSRRLLFILQILLSSYDVNGNQSAFQNGTDLAEKFNSPSCLKARDSSNFKGWQSLMLDANSPLHDKDTLIASQQVYLLKSGFLNDAFTGIKPNSSVYVRNQKVASKTLARHVKFYSGESWEKKGLRSDFRQNPPSFPNYKPTVKCTKSQVYWSFVREPISAFISGWLEATCRDSDGDAGTETFTRFLEKLESKLAKREYHGKSSEHFWPQAHKIDALPKGCKYRYLGKLETFTASLQGLFPSGRVPPKQHEAEDEKCKKKLLKGFSLGPKETRTLCRLLAVDFKCFGYALPMECTNK